MVGHLFRFQTVAEIHAEFIERHAPVCRPRRVDTFIIFLTTEVEIHRRRGECFSLRHIHRVGVSRTSGYIGNLAALNNSFSCLIVAYTDCRFGCFPCRFEFLLLRQSFYEVRMFFFPFIKSLFRFVFFTFRSIVKRLR